MLIAITLQRCRCRRLTKGFVMEFAGENAYAPLLFVNINTYIQGLTFK
jgi:hypothetical protein